MDNTWRFNDDTLGQKTVDEGSKYRTWSGWDILTPKNQEWSSNLVINDTENAEKPLAPYKTMGGELPLGLEVSDLEANAKEFHPQSQRSAVAAQTGTEARASQPPALPKSRERNDEGFKFIVKTFAVESSRHLLLYSIPPSLTAEDLYNIMSAYGDIESMDCNRKDDIGVVLLSYFDLRDATTALERLSTQSMPVEAQYCTSRVDQSSGELFDEHKLVVKPKNMSQRGITLNDVIGLLGEHGEISNFLNSGKDDKLVEFPDSRALKLAIASSSFSNKITVSRVALPVRLYRLGLSLDKFLRCHSNPNGAGQSPKHGVFYDNGLSTLHPRVEVPSQTQFHGNHGMYRNSMSQMPRHDTQVQIQSPRSESGRRVVPGGSHPHHQSLARGVAKKKQPAAEFLINLDNVRNGFDRRTSLMVRNIPNKYDLKMVLEEIDVKFQRKYDFFYLPIDFKNRCNVGYAFINFIDPLDIEEFCTAFDSRKWNRFNSEKVCKISYARIQGKERLVTRFQNSSLMEKDESCRPVIFYSDGPRKGLPASFPPIPHS